MNQKIKTQNRLLSLLLAAVLVVSMIPMTSMTAYAAADTSAYAPTRKENYYNDYNAIFANGTPITIEAAPNGTRVWYMDGTTKKYVTNNDENGEDLSDWNIFVGSANDDGMRGVNGSITMTGGTVKNICAGQWSGYFRGTSYITITGGTVTGGVFCNAPYSVGNNDYIDTITIYDAVGTTLIQNYGGKADNVVQKKDGTWSVIGNGVIPSGVTLTVNEGETLNVPKDATLTNNGSLVNNGGTITIYGKLTGNAPENYVAPSDFTFSPSSTALKANVSATLETPTATTNNTTFVPWFSFEVADAGTTGAVINGTTITPYGAGIVKVKVIMHDGYCTPVEKIYDFSVSFTPVTGISGNVQSEYWVNKDYYLPSTVTPSDASYNTIIWSVVNAGDTGAVINGNKIRATYGGTATIRATITSGKAYGSDFVKDYTIAFATTETIDINVGSVTISKKDDTTLTVTYAGFSGGSKDYSVDAPIVITGTTTENGITVSSGNAYIILNNVSITRGEANAIYINAGATANIELVGENSVIVNEVAAVRVPPNATLSIDGSGSLYAETKNINDQNNNGAAMGGNAYESGGTITINNGKVKVVGSDYGAGIGGGCAGSGGTTTINGGTVITIGGYCGAGIGAGFDFGWGCNGGSVTINGGTVITTGGGGGAGIGGGDAGIGGGDNRGNGGTVIITGGTVRAIPGSGAEAIGKGANGSSSGTLTNKDGVTLSLVTITLDGAGDGVAVTAVDVSCDYSVNQVYTMDGGKLYFYLPGGAEIISITTENGKYICRGGNTFYKEHEYSSDCDDTCNHCGETRDVSSDHHDYDENGICHKATGEPHYQPADYDETNNVYKIANLGNLLWFRDQVNGGNTKINAILTENINGKDDVAKIIGIGTDDKPYEGVFDGNNKTLDIQIVSTEQYAAPFAYVKGAIIKNLTVTGTITSSKKFAASIIGLAKGGTVTLEKCISKVTITSTANSDGTNGGLVANVGGGELKINNCAFVGAYVTSTATSSGGFVGWTNQNAKTTITNSFVAADFSNAKTDGCNTFSRNPNYVTVENCYYLTALGDVPRNGATPKNAKQFASGEVAWLLNGSEDNGTWKQTFYTDKTPNFSGGVVYKTTGNCDSYTNNEAEKNRNHAADENGFCKYCGKVMNLMPAVWNESKRVYEISNAKQLVWFAEFVNGTLEDTKQNQSANAILMNDIDMSEITDYVPIGGTTGLYYSADGDDKGYKGTFDGNGYVIKNLSVNGSDTKELTYGVFGTLSGTVKHLAVENFTFILGSQDCRAGGIAGQMLSGGLIEDCYVANSTINATGKVAGGIAGCNYAGKIINCHTYKVTVTATRVGGIVGDNRGDGGANDRKGSVINCYTDAGNIENSARAGSVTNSTANISESDFASGRICSLLGGSREVWKQTIGSQAYPTFSGDTVKIDGYNVTGTLVSAKITWTAMEFTYTAGDWDPSTDSYGAGTWTVADDGGKITVQNLGNIRLYTKFTYTSSISGVTGKFNIGNTSVESKKSVTSQLTLEGKPDSWNSMLGMVEVKISRNQIDKSWNVGDEVKWVGTDGNEYTCTVVSKSNSGYVLITSNRVKQTKGRSFEDIAKDAQTAGGRLPNTQISAELSYLQKKIGTSSVRIPVYRGDKKTYGALGSNGSKYGYYSYNSSKQHDVYYAFDVPIS